MKLPIFRLLLKIDWRAVNKVCRLHIDRSGGSLVVLSRLVRQLLGRNINFCVRFIGSIVQTKLFSFLFYCCIVVQNTKFIAPNASSCCLTKRQNFFAASRLSKISFSRFIQHLFTMIFVGAILFRFMFFYLFYFFLLTICVLPIQCRDH